MADTLYTATLRFAESLPDKEKQFSYLVEQAKWCDASNSADYNNGCVKKLVTHIAGHFARSNEFKHDERLIDVYWLLGKTSRSMGPKLVFEQVYNMGNLRQVARFYVTWAEIHAKEGDITKVQEIAKLAVENKAQPEEYLQVEFSRMLPAAPEVAPEDTLMVLQSTQSFLSGHNSAAVENVDHPMEVDEVNENAPPADVFAPEVKRHTLRMSTPLASISETSHEGVTEETEKKNFPAAVVPAIQPSNKPAGFSSGFYQDACNVFSHTLPLSQEAKNGTSLSGNGRSDVSKSNPPHPQAAFQIFYDPDTPAPISGPLTSTPFPAGHQQTVQQAFLEFEAEYDNSGLGNTSGGLFGCSSPAPVTKKASVVLSEDGDRTGVGLNATIIGESDPWDQALRMKVLNSSPAPICRQDFLTTKCQPVSLGKTVILGKTKFNIVSILGQGGFAKVFGVTKSDEKSHLALKYESPSCPWEVYMCETARNRLDSEIKEYIMFVNESYIFSNASAIIYEYYHHGTLLDLLNDYKKNGVEMSAVIVMIIGLQIAKILRSVHNAELIHGDIKPDNFMITGPIDEQLLSNPMSRPVVKLIDWGRGIDMRQFKGKSFRGRAGTEVFDCPEMLDGREWTYQTDMFGFVAVIYLLCVGEYISTVKNGNRYAVTKQIKRRFGCRQMWIEIMDMILNIPSCAQLPNWDDILCQMTSQFRETISPDSLDCRKAVERFNKILRKN